MLKEKNSKVKRLTCPICNKPIEYSGESDINCCGETFYIGVCSDKDCKTEFRIYDDKTSYDLWYEVEE